MMPSSSTSMPAVSVCVCTYKRPSGLADLLSGLATQQRLEQGFEIIVVDNDAAGSARRAVEQFSRDAGDIAVRYFVEPRQNIALARNRSVAEAKGDWIAFIDDDEIPEADWLRQLLAAATRCGADGAFGPVTAILPEPCPSWISRGRFFEKRPALTTGDGIAAVDTRTSNAIVRASLLKSRDEPFNKRWGLTGGSDSRLFGDMLSNGARFIWCSEAVVRERVPTDRANMLWLMKRGIRGGQNYADWIIDDEGRGAYGRLVFRALASISASLLIAPIVLPFGRHRSVWWLQRGAHGLGFLVALSSYRYEPYRA